MTDYTTSLLTKENTHDDNELIDVTKDNIRCFGIFKCCRRNKKTRRRNIIDQESFLLTGDNVRVVEDQIIDANRSNQGTVECTDQTVLHSSKDNQDEDKHINNVFIESHISEKIHTGDQTTDSVNINNSFSANYHANVSEGDLGKPQCDSINSLPRINQNNEFKQETGSFNCKQVIAALSCEKIVEHSCIDHLDDTDEKQLHPRSSSDYTASIPVVQINIYDSRCDVLEKVLCLQSVNDDIDLEEKYIVSTDVKHLFLSSGAEDVFESSDCEVDVITEKERTLENAENSIGKDCEEAVEDSNSNVGVTSITCTNSIVNNELSSHDNVELTKDDISVTEVFETSDCEVAVITEEQNISEIAENSIGKDIIVNFEDENVNSVCEKAVENSNYNVVTGTNFIVNNETSSHYDVELTKDDITVSGENLGILCSFTEESDITVSSEKDNFRIAPEGSEDKGGIEAVGSEKHSQNGHEMAHYYSIVSDPLLYTQSDLDDVVSSREKGWKQKEEELESNVKEEIAMRELLEQDHRSKMENLRKDNNDMKTVVGQYEKTIVELTEQSQIVPIVDEDTLSETIRAKDQLQLDLNSAETNLVDAYKRIEKLKIAVDTYKENEDRLKESVNEYQNKLQKSEEKYKRLKQHASEKIDSANIEIDRVRKQKEIDLAGLQAAFKKAQSRVDSLEMEIQQKAQENKELSQICDELINKVSGE